MAPDVQLGGESPSAFMIASGIGRIIPDIPFSHPVDQPGPITR